ncbi:unnamed protein product [Polarella glacialis]|uniref:tRNA/rRNA methyltransferase SpoU type domain-containing protein n=1 Tax=Polarella glacialis TaxID=89957 RepID=A0A813GSV8_POLGL|nr:unnamed protein product [Polarella glacialis]CAE8719309.1 unnamed protein product [Polarella glacialis]
MTLFLPAEAFRFKQHQFDRLNILLCPSLRRTRFASSRSLNYNNSNNNNKNSKNNNNNNNNNSNDNDKKRLALAGAGMAVLMARCSGRSIYGRLSGRLASFGRRGAGTANNNNNCFQEPEFLPAKPAPETAGTPRQLQPKLDSHWFNSLSREARAAHADRLSGTGPIVICDRVWNSGNIGQIIRLCCNMDCSALYLVRDPTRAYSTQFNILHHAAQGKAFWLEGRGRFVDADELEALLPARRTVIGVETTAGALDLFSTDLRPTQEDQALCFVFGAESTGITEKVLHLCDSVVYVPSPGSMKSLNVTHCAAVVLFEWFRQSRQAAAAAPGKLL